MTPSNQTLHYASFRDPAGHVYYKDQTLYRQINTQGLPDLQLLHSSGLYDAATKKGWLIPHQDSDLKNADTPDAVHVIQPDPIPFISYPYEWAFSQYRDAALLTLRLQQLALKHSMSLKDASAYNVQWKNGKPLFIDTLSFEPYTEGTPWSAYRQFCQHFLAPLALMAHCDIRLSKLMASHIDGIPLDLASNLLPTKTRLNLALGLHIHAHAKTQTRYADSQGAPPSTQKKKISRQAMLGLIDNLRNAIKKFTWEPKGTEWGNYYDFTNYSDDAFQNKRNIIESFLDQTQPTTVWDLGANNGLFSRIASHRNIPTLACDIDPAAVEKNYRQLKAQKETHLLPLTMDLTNPSTGIGWHSRERDSLTQRGPAHTAFALALIHHLAIANNVPLPHCADFFADCAQHLIIEFVPKTDSQVKILLATRPDIFPHYNETGFETAFSQRFEQRQKTPVQGSDRTLYLLRRK